jgi:hypothetical protein
MRYFLHLSEQFFGLGFVFGGGTRGKPVGMCLQSFLLVCFADCRKCSEMHVRLIGDIHTLFWGCSIRNFKDFVEVGCHDCFHKLVDPARQVKGLHNGDIMSRASHYFVLGCLYKRRSFAQPRLGLPTQGPGLFLFMTFELGPLLSLSNNLVHQSIVPPS